MALENKTNYDTYGVSLNTFSIAFTLIMASVSQWRKWLLQQLIGEGVHNALLEESIRKEVGRHYDANLDIALRLLMDDGIIM